MEEERKAKKGAVKTAFLYWFSCLDFSHVHTMVQLYVEITINCPCLQDTG